MSRIHNDSHRVVSQPCEVLESRQLLSVSLDDGVLLVKGSAAGDQIQLKDNGEQIVVTANDDVTTFDSGDVEHLAVEAGAGADMVDFHTLGEDVFVMAQSGDDTVLGGAGDDSIGG